MTWKQYDRLRAKDEERDDHISPTSYLGQKLAKGVNTVAHVTNFKHQLETRTEYRDRQKAEKAAEQQACYRAVDQRDLSICRVTDVYVTAGASDPHKRKEHHHMLPRSRGGADTMANVITISGFIHQLIHAGKLHLSGDANLKDQEGRFCGVKCERMTDSGWKTERML